MSDRTESPPPASPVDNPSETSIYDPAALEFQSKIIHGHTQNTGVFFGRFCSGFAAYSRNLAQIRDKGDDIARSFAQFSETQSHSPVTKKQLTEFSGLLAAVQDHMHARILRIENKVVGGFAKYGTMCQQLKTEVEKSVHIRDRERKYQDDLQKLNVKIKSDNDSQARQHKMESAVIAASEAQRTHELLIHKANKFEQQKLEDMRRALMNFCEIELTFHSKALKIYTQAYRSAKKLDMVDDVVKFRTHMNIVKRSSSVGPDPSLILESYRVDCVPPESSSGSELSSASLSDGGHGEQDSPRQAASKGSKLSSTQPRKKSRLVEKFSPLVLSKAKRAKKSYIGVRAPRYIKTVPNGTCANHLEEYEKAIKQRGNSLRH